jgi:hypothetical protein
MIDPRGVECVFDSWQRGVLWYVCGQARVFGRPGVQQEETWGVLKQTQQAQLCDMHTLEVKRG